ncbi:MAG: AAA family ATPase, partial [Bradyrhizobium sp.]|nr:AAA family ATPase [Bradyrhizobium sp.]
MTRLDAESAVLGAILLDPAAYWRVADLLTAADFTRDVYRSLWTALGSLARSNTPIDAITVGERAPEIATLALELVRDTPSSANAKAYAEIVAKDATTRRVRNAGERIAKLGGDDVLGEAQKLLGSCAPQTLTAIKPARDFMRESVARMQSRLEAEDVLSGIPTGLSELDERTAGWQRGDLVILAARPSVGKTALAMQWAIHAAKAGHPALFMSLEMSGSQLTDRALSHLGRVS